MRYRNHFLDAHHSKICHVTKSSYPYDNDWALWYLEDEGNGNVSFCSKCYSDSRLDVHHGGQLKLPIVLASVHCLRYVNQTTKYCCLVTTILKDQHQCIQSTQKKWESRRRGQVRVRIQSVQK